MPTAPMLPPDEMAKAQQTAGIDPANFLIAAADMHGAGQLSAPVPKGKDPLARAFDRKPLRKLKVIK